MTAIWTASLGGLLLLFIGALMGTSWTDQALRQQYQRLLIELRELQEWNHTLQDASLQCVLCGSLASHLPPERSEVGSRMSAALCSDPARRDSSRRW